VAYIFENGKEFVTPMNESMVRGVELRLSALERENDELKRIVAAKDSALLASEIKNSAVWGMSLSLIDLIHKGHNQDAPTFAECNEPPCRRVRAVSRGEVGA
jgi:hypothetical protein